MDWSPNFEEDIDLEPIFEQYEQQDEQYNCALVTLRPKHCALEVDTTDFEDTKTCDRSELVKAICRKLGPEKKKELRKWDDQQDEIGVEDIEISKIITSVGQGPEPSTYYRPRTATTSRTAILSDELPVPGVKDVHVTREHFKFKNPYVVTPVQVEPISEKEHKCDNSINTSRTELGSASAGAGCERTRSYEDPTMGVAGEEYVSPVRSFALRARWHR